MKTLTFIFTLLCAASFAQKPTKHIVHLADECYIWLSEDATNTQWKPKDSKTVIKMWPDEVLTLYVKFDTGTVMLKLKPIEGGGKTTSIAKPLARRHE